MKKKKNEKKEGKQKDNQHKHKRYMGIAIGFTAAAPENLYKANNGIRPYYTCYSATFM